MREKGLERISEAGGEEGGRWHGGEGGVCS